MANTSSESRFKPGNVLWIKFGQLHWPAEVLAFDSLPQIIKDDFKDRIAPKVVAKFFDEDGYEFYDDDKNLLDYNCPKKEDFIKKGIVRCRQKTKEGSKEDWVAKFPNDIIKAEKLIQGDIHILEKDPFVERKEPKISYKDIFGTPDDGKKGKKKGKDTPKGKDLKRKSSASPVPSTPKSRKKGDANKTPNRPIIHPRFREGGGGSDHQVKLLPQLSAPIDMDLQVKQEKAAVATNAYTCQLCPNFSTARLNVLVLHQKSCKGNSEPTKSPSGSSRGTPSKTKATSSSSKQQTPKRKQDQSPKAKSPAVGRNKGKEPSETSKSSPKKLINSASITKSSPKKSADDTSKQKNGLGTKSDAKIESAPKRRTATSNSNTSINSTPTKNKNTSVSLSSSKQSSSISPLKSSTKRKRMTKQEKLEREKKAEERSKIIDDWSEEEEEEAEEKKQIKEILKQKGGDGSDESGSEEEREPAFLGDDNIHGYDDDDEEILPPEPITPKSSSSEKATNKSSGDNELKEKLKSEKTTKENSKNDSGDDKLLDINKMLEETSVPTISIDTENKDTPKKPKRGVKFSEELSKDIAIKKIQLVQTASNLADPMDVDDEFAFSEEPELAVAKPILKRPNRPPPKIIHEPVKPEEEKEGITGSVESLNEPSNDESKKVECDESTHSNISSCTDSKSSDLNNVTISDKPSETSGESESKPAPATTISQPDTESSSTTPPQEDKPNPNTECKSSTPPSQVDSSNIPHQLTSSVENKEENVNHQKAGANDQTLESVGENKETGVTGAGQPATTDQEETYILLVDDNSDHVVDSLNSQLLYLDSNSLANGNVVLMTQDSVNAANQQENNGTANIANAENNGVANGGSVLSMPPGGMQSLEPQVATTVDTKGGVATIPGQTQQPSAASQIQLITSPAQAPGPLVSATAKPSSIQSSE